MRAKNVTTKTMKDLILSPSSVEGLTTLSTCSLSYQEKTKKEGVPMATGIG